MSEVGVRHVPRFYWAIAVVSLVWNAFGVFDFTMTNLHDAWYLGESPPGVLAYVERMPWWALAGWAAGVWGAVAGSLLLLLRSRHAVLAFVVSLAGLALSTLHQLTDEETEGMQTEAMLVMTLVIWVIGIALLWYARTMRRSGVLA